MQKNIDDNDSQNKIVVKTCGMLKDVLFPVFLFDCFAWIKNKEDFVEKAPILILVSLALGCVICLITNVKVIKQESLQWTRKILISAILLKVFNIYSWVSGISSIEIMLHSWYFWISQVLGLLFIFSLLVAHDELASKKI